MNILHLKYAVEVEKTKSINKAAENLFMAQPNLSRAIKELEDYLGITIFKRTSKGMSVTPQGEEFLQYAKRILANIEEVENIYKNNGVEKQMFSISVPRASYIAEAFTEFSKGIDMTKKAEIFYKETNALRAITNILQSNYQLGIIRYQLKFDSYFKSMIREKGLKGELITEFTYVLVMSKNHPLASKEEIVYKDLEPYIEIAHADPYVPSLPFSDVKKIELPDNIEKRIFVFERGSQFDLLERIPNTFMWVSPIPERLLDKYELVQKQCVSNTKVYKDVLIYKKGYSFTELDNKFIEELLNSKRNIINR